MSFTMYVPDSVPSENQSSAPAADVVAEKKKPVGVEPVGPLEGLLKVMLLTEVPGLMSFTMYVPADVPSVRQSSLPAVAV